MVLAIIGLIGTLLVGSSMHLLASRTATPEDVFLQAVQEARKTALKSEKEVRLVFKKTAEGGQEFLIVDSASAVASSDPLAAAGAATDASAGVLQQLPIPPPARGTKAEDVDVTFVIAQKGGNTMLVGGVAVETTTVPYVKFYTDGTCSPFRAQFVRGGDSHVMSIDPWTCAAELPAVDPNAPPTP
jgi:hypothetical protein